jgi:hypothetical protein
MKKIMPLAYSVLGILPSNVLAKMGYLFPEDEYRSGGGFPFFDFIVVILIAGWFYKTFIDDVLSWKERRRNKEKFDFSSIKEGFGGFLFIYALRGIFLALPIFYIATWIGGTEFIKEFWLYIFITIITIQFIFSNP